MKELCQVIISQNKDPGIPIGLITGFNNNIYFDPLTVLTELRYKPENVDLEDFYFDDYDYSSEYGFNSIIHLKDTERKQYVAVVKNIKKLILWSYTNKTSISLSTLELLRPYYDITFVFSPTTIVKKIDTPFSHENHLHKRYVHYNSVPLEILLEKGTSLYKEYFYQCYSPADIVFSILYFLSINAYKFNKCMHCNRFFATKSYKTIYCHRLSEYQDFEQYTCCEAVKRIRQDIQRKHSQIYKNLSANYTYQQLESFQKKYLELFEKLKIKSDYDTITKCYQIVNKDKWYSKEAIRIIGEKEPTH